MRSEFRPEEQLVVTCARTGAVPEADLAAVLDRPLEWDVVVETAITHGVAPLVSDALRRCAPDAVPDEARGRLRARSQAVAARNLRLLREVAALSAAFERRGIRAIPYRGPVVADIAYGAVGLREFGDLDFLLAYDDLPAAKSLLGERGYEPRYIFESTTGLTEGQEWAYTRFERDYPFEHASTNVEVELHWRVLSQHFPTDIDLDTVWERRSTRSIDGTDVPVLSPEDRLLMLCIHGTRHQWERLEWICDVAEFLERNSVDWDELVRRARANSCERMVALGLAVARDLFDAPMPGWIRRWIDADEEIGPLEAFVFERLFDEDEYWNVDLRRYQARSVERYRDKLRVWACWVLKPDRGDIETVSLPRSLAPLYTLVRFGRLTSAAVDRFTAADSGGRRFRERADG